VCVLFWKKLKKDDEEGVRKVVGKKRIEEGEILQHNSS